MAKKKTSQDNHDEDDGPTVVELPVQFYFPEGLPTPYANQCVVQSTGHEVILWFFEVSPPAFPNMSHAERKKSLENLGHVRGNYVSKVAMTKEKFLEVATIIAKTANAIDTVSTVEKTR
ncbi:hypothetical protein K2Y11_21305 [bacterium]|nr:hypothetical protein [bacterium]